MNDDEICLHLESDRVAFIIDEWAGKLIMWDCSLLTICSGRLWLSAEYCFIQNATVSAVLHISMGLGMQKTERLSLG